MKSIFFALILLLSQLANAQYQSLAGEYPKQSVSWWANPIVEIERNAFAFGAFMGGEGGIILNNHYSLGLYITTAVGGFYPPGFDDLSYYRNYFDQGGLVAAYEMTPHALIHPFVKVRMGYGNLALGESLGTTYLNLGLYVLQPSVGMKININSHLRGGVAMFYRIVNPVDLYLQKDANFNAVGLSLILEVGKFKK